ncbi:hypothetical protein CALVIDRAFT_541068 [Calocera viscosa TUFC12733]|uniref:Uncharacterized protein n=1 Tax=Calocera viscosa (strain TUFC12733) TaxID=1330018 RepID=A0A167I3E2_CALVF|nr:hypothetical protein CALVIDRAFT_541068 [Calocera viscosa TUFC12733]
MLVSQLLAVCLLPLGVLSAVLPRQSPEPNCNPSCPPQIIPGYAVVWSGFSYGNVSYLGYRRQLKRTGRLGKMF